MTYWCSDCNTRVVLAAGTRCEGCRSPVGRHTCHDTRSGSERSENTCAACHDELRAYQQRNPPDFSWLYENCTPRTELSAREHEAQRASPKTTRGT